MCSKASEQTNEQRITILLKNYEELIELYKFWFDLTVKVNFYQFLIAGSILSYVFSNDNSRLGGFALVGLWVPIFSGIGIAGMYLFGSRNQFQLDKKLDKIRKELGIVAGARYFLLGYSLIIFGLIHAAISCVCIFMACSEWPSESVGK